MQKWLILSEACGGKYRYLRILTIFRFTLLGKSSDQSLVGSVTTEALRRTVKEKKEYTEIKRKTEDLKEKMKRRD